MKRILFVVLVLISSNIFAQQEVLEKIVAVVDNEIILQSELNFRALDEGSKKNIDPNSKELKARILKQMIDEKLLYAQAQIDTVKLADEEINQSADYRLGSLVQQYGSKENLEKASNMSYEKLKKYLRDELKKTLMIQKLIEAKFGKIQVNSEEVKDFYKSYKDSLGLVNEKYTIAHIFVNPKTGDRIQKAAKDLAQSILDSLKKGADFATMAKRYSNDASASNGGDLGEAKRGVYVPEFEAAAFSLAPKQISELVKSQHGYHIIQLIERKGEMVHCRHILIKPKSDDKNDLETISFLSDLRDSIMLKKNTFDYYARKYSDDKNSARMGGELGTFEASQLEKQMVEQLVKMKDGDIGFPKRLDIGDVYGFHLLKLIKKVPQHRADLDLDYDEIKNIVIQKKKNEYLTNYINDIKNTIYWEIKE
jgi:peptidyl-prolyl cis-trans isomerase SurA